MDVSVRDLGVCMVGCIAKPNIVHLRHKYVYPYKGLLVFI